MGKSREKKYFLKNYKLLVLIFSCMLLGGCASSHTASQDVHYYEQEIASSQRKIDQAKRFLQNNTDVYVNGACVTPSRGRQPSPYCPSYEKAKEHAIRQCVIPIGCDLASYYFSEELDTFSKKFLASEACSRWVNSYQQGSYSLATTGVNAIESFADAKWQNNPNKLSGKIGAAVSILIKGQKVFNLLSCLERTREHCIQNYKSWISMPSRKKEICEEHLRTLVVERDVLRENMAILIEKKDSLVWKAFGDEKKMHDANKVFVRF